MANLERQFQLVGKASEGQAERVKKAVEALVGVNHAAVGNNYVIVDYVPGMIAVQSIKETIESQGCDVSDQGDD